MPTAVNVTRLFSIALDGIIISDPGSSSLTMESQPVDGPLMLPDNTSEWVELAADSDPIDVVDGGMHPEWVNYYNHAAKFKLQLYFRADAVGLTQGPEGFKFPAGTTMQFGVIAPPGVNLVPGLNAGGERYLPYCWWNSDGYWALDTGFWSVPDNPADFGNIRFFVVLTSALAPPPRPSEFWTNFIGSHEII